VHRASTTTILGICAVLLAAVTTPMCSGPAPGVIHYDGDSCDHCRMTISDPTFAAQLVIKTGRVYRFDDPACLASFVASGRVAAADVHSIWLNDYGHPDTRVNALDAVFVVSDRIRAPMNGGAAAFASRVEATALQSAVGGQLRAWADILKRVSS
jgi:copper chaperone NosL